jgi:predicted nucleotidyltransferase
MTSASRAGSRNHPSAARRAEVDGLLDRVASWLGDRDDVVAVGLLGSWARGNPTPRSDVDLVIITESPASYTTDVTWIAGLPGARLVRTQQWGPLLTERRLVLPSGLEVDVGITDRRWASTDPVDDGTARVIADDGLLALHDPDGVLAALASSVAGRQRR